MHGNCQVFIGNSWDVSEAFSLITEEYICAIYSAKKKKLSALKEQKFLLKHVNESKIIDFLVYHRVSRRYFFMENMQIMWQSYGKHVLILILCYKRTH